jgi:hypothetical protein
MFNALPTYLYVGRTIADEIDAIFRDAIEKQVVKQQEEMYYLVDAAILNPKFRTRAIAP